MAKKNQRTEEEEREEEEEEEIEEDEEDEDELDGGTAKKGGPSLKASKKRTHNDDEDEESDADDARGNESSAQAATKAPKADASPPLPLRKPSLLEFQLFIPGCDAGKVTVAVHLSDEQPLSVRRRPFPSDKGGAEGDDGEAHRWQAGEGEEEEEEDEEGGRKREEEDEEGDEEGNQRNKNANGAALCPPWLPHLLNDDTFYWERTIGIMYGYAAKPPPPPLPSAGRRTGSFISCPTGPSTNGDHDNGEGGPLIESLIGMEEEDGGVREKMTGDEDSEERMRNESMSASGETVEGGCRVQDEVKDIKEAVKDDNFDSFPNYDPPPFCIETGAEDSNTEDDQNIPINITARQPSMLTVLCFPESNRLFFLIPNKRQPAQWYLYDSLPAVSPRRGRDGTETRKRRGSEEDDDNDEGGGGDDDDDEEGDENGEEEEEADEEDAKLPNTNLVADDEDEEEDDLLDVAAAVPIDALMLAALLSPTALRCCLSQRTAVSFTCLEAWLRRDPHATLPLLITIHRTMLSVHATDQLRLPYRLPESVLDFNVFFSPRFLCLGPTSLQPLSSSNFSEVVDMAGTAAGSTRMDEGIPADGERRSYETMDRLLRVGVVPSRPVRLSFLSSAATMRLLLWLLLRVPTTILDAWAVAKDIDKTEATEDSLNENDEDNEADESESESENEEDEGRGSAEKGARAAHQLLLRWARGPAEDKTKMGSESSNPRAQFVPAPMLLAVVREIRRRQQRDVNGEAPSQFSLIECLGRALVTRVEDGRRGHDPLVTKFFSAFPLSPPRPLGEVNVANEKEMGAAAGDLSGAIRMQNVYQSDLVLLLLCLVSTPARRESVPVNDDILTDTNSTDITSLKEKDRQTVLKVRQTACSLTVGVADAHVELIDYLLRKKAERVRSALETAASGYMRLLLICFPRINNAYTAQLLLSHAPLFTLLGPLDRVPLGDILHAWSIERSAPTGCPFTASGSGCPLSSSVNRTVPPLTSLASFRSPQSGGPHADLFLGTFWNELYFRFRAQHYDNATMALARAQLIVEKVHERRRAYVSVLWQLGACRRSPSLKTLTMPSFGTLSSSPHHSGAGAQHGQWDSRRLSNARASMAHSRASMAHSRVSMAHSRASMAHSRASMAHSRASVTSPITSAIQSLTGNVHVAGKRVSQSFVPAETLNVYADEFHVEEERVRMIFRSLAMSPRTYLTPESLYAILFDVRAQNAYAVRYLMVRCGVATVHSDPLREQPIPAMECAVRRGDLRAVNVLRLVGDSLDIPMDGGRSVADAWIAESAPPREAKNTIAQWRSVEEMRSVDPAVQYGVLNTVPSAA